MKMNIIASGQVEAGFSTAQGLQLTSEVAKLAARFDSLASEQEKQFGQVREEAQGNVQQVTKETRAVFDAIMRDIDSLQSETEKLRASSALEELETHLTERITMLSENSLEMNST